MCYTFSMLYSRKNIILHHFLSIPGIGGKALRSFSQSLQNDISLSALEKLLEKTDLPEKKRLLLKNAIQTFNETLLSEELARYEIHLISQEDRSKSLSKKIP